MRKLQYLVFAIIASFICFARQAIASQEAIVLGSDKIGDGYGYLLNLDSGTTMGWVQFPCRRPEISDGIFVENGSGQPVVYAIADTILFKIIPINGKLMIERISSSDCYTHGVAFDSVKNAPATSLESRDQSGKSHRLGLRTLIDKKWADADIDNLVFNHPNFPSWELPKTLLEHDKMVELFPEKKKEILTRAKSKEKWILIGQSTGFTAYNLPAEIPVPEESVEESTVLIRDRKMNRVLVFKFPPMTFTYVYPSILFFKQVGFKDVMQGHETPEIGKNSILFEGSEKLVECNVQTGMRHLYATHQKAYFEKDRMLYQVSISPSGCGTPEKVMKLPFKPSRFFAFESPKPSQTEINQ